MSHSPQRYFCSLYHLLRRFTIKKYLYYACYLPMHQYILFMVVSTTCGESISVYVGIFTVEEYSERYFFLAWIVHLLRRFKFLNIGMYFTFSTC
jgi:hypothetical protein